MSRPVGSEAPDDGLAIADALMETHRETPLRGVRAVRLRTDAGHPQGMARVGDRWWVTTIDRRAHAGAVLVLDDDGREETRLAVGRGDCQHPGGMCPDAAGVLWVAAAAYRPDSETVVYRVDTATGEVVEAFGIADHLGVLLPDGRDGLVGFSWGSRRIYRLSTAGAIVEEVPNANHLVDWQDGQVLGDRWLALGGVAGLRQNVPFLRYQLGGLGLYDLEQLRPAHVLPITKRSPAGRVMTFNPMWLSLEPGTGALLLHCLPDDRRGWLLTARFS